VEERMIKEEEKISLTQLFVLTIQLQIGTGILVLPHNIYEYAKKDSWISILIAGVIVQLVIILLWCLMTRYPGLHFFQVTQILLGKWLGNGINLFYLAFYIITNAILLLNMSHILNKWAYPKTPKWVILLLFVAVSVYIARQSLKAISRFYLLATFLHILFIVMMLINLKDGNLVNLQPVGQEDFSSILLGAKTTLLPILGFGVLIVANPYVNGTERAILKTVSLASWYVISFYMIITLSTMIFFLPEEITFIPEPSLYVLKTISFEIIERVDLIFLSFWLVSTITTFAGYLYLSSKSLAQTFQTNNHSRFVLFAAIITYCIAIWENDPDFYRKWEQYLESFALMTLVCIPIFLLLLSLIKQRKRGGYE
jgi:spore germination protein (amino acid permease)